MLGWVLGVDGGSTKTIAMQTLMAHPMGPPWEVAKPLLDELLAANLGCLGWVSEPLKH